MQEMTTLLAGRWLNDDEDAHPRASRWVLRHWTPQDAGWTYFSALSRH